MNSPPQPDTWIGRLIGDRQRYRLDQRLDSGGMGYVFLAMDTLLGQQVALKLLKETLAGSEELRKRFEREVALSAALKSENIVEVSDYGVTPEGNPFYIMEYLRGQSLGQLLRREKRLPVERTLDIISQVCNGLQLAHKGVTLWRHNATASEHVKVVHRDLKPDNIFLVPTALGELVKILDFGIAKKIRDDSVEQTNLTSTFLGTFRYAAPEQLGIVKNLDGRADIYSLGVILYEILSGSDPFGFGIKVRSTTGVSWALAHTSKPPQSLRSQPGCEHLSPELEAVVMRCLQKAPYDRFGSVDELTRALQAAIPQPRTPARQEVPDATIAQVPPLPKHSDDSTVNRPLAAEHDATIAQIQPPNQGNDTTIPRLRTPARQEVPDATIAQVPPLPKHSDDSTVNRPLAAGQGGTAETTIFQPPPLPEQITDATIAQIPTPPGQITRSLPSHFLLSLGGIAICLVVTGGIFAYIQLQPRESPFVKNIKTLKTEAKYEDCIAEAKTVTEDSNFYNDAQMLLNECLLEHAKKLAQSNDFQSAIAVAREITQNSSLHSEAQLLIAQWSKQIDDSIF